jgi:hypothetical protein
VIAPGGNAPPIKGRVVRLTQKVDRGWFVLGSHPKRFPAPIAVKGDRGGRSPVDLEISTSTTRRDLTPPWTGRSPPFFVGCHWRAIAETG